MGFETKLRYPNSLDSRAIEFAGAQLNETETKRIEYIHHLRVHFKDHEPSIRLSDDDTLLVAFLRCCKYNLERTIKKVRNYYIMRGKMPEIFARRDPEVGRMQMLLALGFFVPLRKFNDDRLVIVIRPGRYDPAEFHLAEILKVGYLIVDICAKICPQTQVYGICALFDMQACGLGHLRTLTPSIIKHIVHSWENYHCRPKQLAFFNAPSYLNIVLNIFRTFMSAKLKKRLHVYYNGNASLHQLMDKSILPEEYGGHDGTLDDHIRFWNEEVIRQKDWLLHNEQFIAETISS